MLTVDLLRNYFSYADSSSNSFDITGSLVDACVISLLHKVTQHDFSRRQDSHFVTGVLLQAKPFQYSVGALKQESTGLSFNTSRVSDQKLKSQIDWRKEFDYAKKSLEELKKTAIKLIKVTDFNEVKERLKTIVDNTHFSALKDASDKENFVKAINTELDSLKSMEQLTKYITLNFEKAIKFCDKSMEVLDSTAMQNSLSSSNPTSLPHYQQLLATSQPSVYDTVTYDTVQELTEEDEANSPLPKRTTSIGKNSKESTPLTQ